MTVSEGDIFTSLIEHWKEWFGSDHPVDPETEVVQWLRNDEIDLFELNWYVEKHFGVTIPEEVWCEFIGLERPFEDQEERIMRPATFGQLAQLIRAHLPDVSFDAVEICGRKCGPAGAYFGLEHLASHVVDDLKRFAPSTKIKDRIKDDELVRFWSLLQVLTRGAVPPLVPYSQLCWVRLGFLAAYVGQVWIFVSVIEALGLNDRWIIISSTIGLLLAFAALVVDASPCGSPPADLRSFRDLAQRIVESRYRVRCSA